MTLKVIGLVLTATGEADRHVLHDILEQKYERAHIRAIFNDSPEAIKLTVVENQEEFRAATRPGGIADIVFESERAPRIQIFDKLYWPPTERLAAVVRERLAALMATGNPDWNALQELTFEQLEGTDISAIWGKTWSGHPSSRGEDWPIKFGPSGSRSERTVPAYRRINPKKKRHRWR